MRDVRVKPHPLHPDRMLVRFGTGTKWRLMSRHKAERLLINDALAVLREARRRTYKPRKRRKRQLFPRV